MPAPLTGFEQRGRVAPWTTWEEGETFLADLVASSSRITMTTAGTSVQGRPMRVLRVGRGPRTILYVGQVHGSELSGREALLTMLRQWADSTDPALLDYLSQVSVYVMPTCHPDNFTDRNNVNGVNLNRDHVRLTQPETQAIHRVIRDIRPDLIVDWHEGANIAANFASQSIHNPNADDAIRAIGEQLNAHIEATITGAGYTWELYQGPTGMMKGAENLANNAGVRGMVGLLLETARVYEDDTNAALRHDLMLLCVDAIWRWHRTRIDALAAEVTAARQRIASATGPITLNIETFPTGPVVTPPEHYYLNPQEHEAIAVQRELLGLASFRAGDGYGIPTAQEARVVLAYLMDPASERWLVEARSTPYRRALAQPIRISPDTVMKFRHEGVTRKATLKVKA